jgi:hypothetical protein
MKCGICGNDSGKVFQASVMNRHMVNYHHCRQCGFVQTEHPFWLEEAYAKESVKADTGAISRNIALARKTAALLFFLFDPRARYLDYAGGYGIMTRLMRDIGFDFYWSDPYAPNLFARGFEFDGGTEIELLTTFESFEHFVNPLQEMEILQGISDNILFTTQLLPREVPMPGDWWYYSLAGGQHVSFYSLETLKYIADRYGMNLLSNEADIHLLTRRTVSDRMFNAILKGSDLLYCYVKMRMKSRTMEDFDRFTARNSGERRHDSDPAVPAVLDRE